MVKKKTIFDPQPNPLVAPKPEPKELPQSILPPINPNLYKGIDISKSFKNTDFANKHDYEQAKRRAESWAVGPEGIAQARMLTSQKEGEVAAIIQAKRMASLDPALLQQAEQLGNTPLPTAEMPSLDFGQALKEGGIVAGEAAAAGAATGAVAGAIGTGGTLSVPIAAAGGGFRWDRWVYSRIC